MRRQIWWGYLTVLVLANVGHSIANQPDEGRRASLYVLAVGISDYPAQLKLNFAAKDAHNLARAFQQYSKPLFEKIEVKELTDKQATQREILKGITWLRKQMTQRDVGVVFLAGHGELASNGTFYFLPSDVDPDDITATGVHAEQIKTTLAALPGKVILLLDACHAGAAGKNKRRTAGALTDELVRDLAGDERGIIVMCASTGKQFSLESEQHQQGMFTLALVEGLQGKAKQVEGQVYLHHLDAYVTDRVRELSRGEQSPVTIRPASIRSFPLTRPSPSAEPARWQPANTRAFIVCLTRFQGDKGPTFTTDDRLDDQLALVLQKRGVPKNQIVLLQDEQATSKKIQEEFVNLLRQSKPGETLFFYFGSSGGYNADRGSCWFSSFDGSVPYEWVFDAIEQHFKGSHAILTADACHSGGIVELARKRKLSVACACLSSTHMHQKAWSGWRFLQCLIRGLQGSAVVDRADSGHVDWLGLAEYTRHYMALAAEGKPDFTAVNGFDPRIRLARVDVRKQDPRVGELVEVQSRWPWTRAEIVEAKGDRLKVHYTADTRTKQDEWVRADQVRPPVLEPIRIGTKVELLGASSRKWFPGVVEKSWESLHFCRYQGYGPEHSEWFGPSRIRPVFAGSWAGAWGNDAGENGKDSLVMQVKDQDTLTGTWGDGIPVTAERLGKYAFAFEVKTAKRTYRVAGRIEGPWLFLDYAARSDQSKYFGWAVLAQQQTAVEPPPPPAF
jgi:hypothetical protein